MAQALVTRSASKRNICKGMAKNLGRSGNLERRFSRQLVIVVVSSFTEATLVAFNMLVHSQEDHTRAKGELELNRLKALFPIVVEMFLIIDNMVVEACGH